MRARRLIRTLSLTELLVVIALILILASIIVVSTEGVYAHARQLQCEHRLEQLWKACQMFANANGGRYPQAWAPNEGTWYEALVNHKYLDSLDIVACPSADAAAESSEAGGYSRESILPTLIYNTGVGRFEQGAWASWDPFIYARDWLNENLPYGIDYCQANYTHEVVYVTRDLLGAYSQFWLLTTENCPATFWSSAELDAMERFHAAGGGLHVLSESYDNAYTYLRAANEIQAKIGYGIVGDEIHIPCMWTLNQSDHPVLFDGETHVTKMYSRYSPAKLVVDPNDPKAAAIGQAAGTCVVAVWDDGVGRVVVHGSYTILCDYDGTDHFNYPGTHVPEYCKNVDAWLRRSAGLRAVGACTYGYNNQLGKDRGTPARDTICIMDYNDWQIDRDSPDPAQNDDDSYIAPRHSGRANAIFVDGHVKALRVGDIGLGMWTTAPGD